MADTLRKLGVRLTAEGVNQYKEDLRSAGREARLMSQETKLAMLELGNNASTTDKFTTKLKSLEREYTVQENKLKTLTNAQKEYQTSLNMVEREIKGTSDELKRSQQETDRLEKEYRELGKSAGWNAEETKKAKQAWQESKVETKELATSLNELEKEQGQYTKELDKMPGKMNAAKIEMAELSNEMARAREEYIKSGGEWSGVADGIEKVSGRIRSVSEGMIEAGDVLTTRVTLPIVAGVAATVKAASDWESAFAGVRKTVDEVVDANGNVVYSYEQIEEELRGLTKELPATHAEIAGVAEAAGQLGIQTENVTSFTKTMIDMGESTNLSAEVAAESLARFANITGMSQDNFDKLGSSIVDLGNNFATTEADIVAMAMRLAGAGSQVGLSEADILGLSAALSSVGIEAEMGGSAISKVMVNMAVASETGLDKVRELEQATGMTARELELMASNNSKDFKALADSLGMTTKEINDIVKAGNDLEGFAAIAGMTGEEFKQAFQEDAVGALGAFIEGLGTAEEKGTTAIELLDELGISEVRLRDSLLRAGNASELFATAIDQSNQAFEENTALSTEANTRYETLESQLGMLRNEVVDVAIELGGPFVAAIREGIQIAKPMLESASDLAQAFNDLDEDTQRTIVTWLGVAAAAGPVIGTMGRIGRATATTGDGIEWLVRKVGGLKTSADMAKPAVDATGTAISTMGSTAATAGGVKGVGAFTASLGTALPWVAGIALAVGAGYGAWKLWGEGAWEASERTKRWGSDIGEEADQALTEFQNLSTEVEISTSQMMFNVEEGAQGAIDAYGSMAEGIKESVNDTITNTQEQMAELPQTVKDIVAESLTEGIEGQRELIAEVDAIQAEITAVYENAVQENRELTDEELQIIENYHQRLSEIRNETLQLSADEQRRVQAVMAEDLRSFSMEQLAQRQEMLHEEKELIRQQYDEQAQMLEDNFTAGILSRAEYNEAIQALNQEEIDDMLVIGAEYMKVWEERGDIPRNIQEKILADMGLTYNQVQQYLALTNETVSESNRIIAETSENATEKVREANSAWNEMVLDEKTGKVNTNLQEVIHEASQSEEGWANLEFIMHNAELDTNAMEIIKEALMANGMWWEIDLPLKFARMQTNAPEEAIKFLKAHGVWKNLPFETQTAILDSNSTEEIVDIVKDHETWKALPWNLKKALVDTNARQTQGTFTTAHAEWEGRKWTPKSTSIDVSSNASTVAGQAQSHINSVTGRTVTIRTRYETVGSAPRGIGPYATRATGDQHFEGGPVWLGDGGRKEPYLTPSGHFGVSGDDWELHNLPKGTRIWPSRQSFKTAARYDDSLKQYLDSIPKFARGGTIENPYDGYTGLVGEAGPEIFQIAQGKVSITPITQSQRTQVLEQHGVNGGGKTDELLMQLLEQNNQLIQLVAQGQVIQMDGTTVGRTVYDEVDGIMNRNFDRRNLMSMKGGG